MLKVSTYPWCAGTYNCNIYSSHSMSVTFSVSGFFFLLYSMTCFFSSCYRWPDSPVSRGAGKHSGVTYTAQWTYCSSGEETHSDGLVLGTSNCFIILRIRWPKRKDSDTVFHHLKHNWESLVLYHRGLHHPQSFTATTNNNFKKTSLQQSVFFISLLWLSCVPYWE